MRTFVVLLRGINVGQHRQIPMAKLKEELEEMGFSKVVTYIRSGNIILQRHEGEPLTIAALVSQLIARQYGFTIPVIVYTKSEYCQFHQGLTRLVSCLEDGQQLVYGYSQETLRDPSYECCIGSEAAFIREQVLVMRIGLKLSESPLMKQLGKKKALQQVITVRNQKTSDALLKLLEDY